TQVIHSSTNGIHALKLIRPRTEPSMRIGVIAANTNWKYTSEDCGKWNGGPVLIDGLSAWPCSPTWPSTLPGSPRNVPRQPFVPKTPDPLWAPGWPAPIWDAPQPQPTRTSQTATKRRP